jgi:hypothetical protein
MAISSRTAVLEAPRRREMIGFRALGNVFAAPTQ